MGADVQAKINALFNDIESLKNQRKRDMDLINLKTEEIISELKIDQEVLVYKNDEPHILKVEIKESTKFDRAGLAEDLDVSQRELNIPGVTELTEKKIITSDALDSYWLEEAEPKIKVKKATNADVERFLQFNIDDFLE